MSEAILAMSGFLGVLILYLHRNTTKQLTGLRGDMTDQGRDLRTEIADQGKELRQAITDQGKELRQAITDQGKELRTEIAGCESRLGDRISDLSALVTALADSTLDLSRSVGRLEGSHEAARQTEAA